MGSDKLSEAEFTLRAIVALRRGSYRGIHVVFSGFNQAFREYFKADPVAGVNRLVNQGVIELRQAGKGVVIYLRGECPEEGGRAALRRMGLLE